MRKKLIVSIILGCVSLFALFAYVIGGTNFGFSGYPSFSEFTPHQPYTSYDGTVSKSQYETYKRDVENYVNAAKEYIENGNNDIKRIQDAQQSALDQANSIVREYNRWIESVKISSSYF